MDGPGGWLARPPWPVVLMIPAVVAVEFLLGLPEKTVRDDRPLKGGDL